VGAVAGSSAEAGGAPAATTAPTDGADRVLLSVAAVSTCVLVVWVVRRLVYRRKLGLGNTPGRANALTSLHLFAVFIAWTLGQMLAVRVAASVPGVGEARALVAGGAGGSVVLLAASVVVGASAFRLGVRRGMGLSLRHWLYDTGRGVVGFFVIFCVCFGLLIAVSALVGRQYVREHEHPMLLALRDFRGAWRLVVIVSAVVLAPLAEEAFFRGLVQSTFRRYTNRPWAAILCASGLFAAVHYGTPHAMPALFALGVALGYNYERCGRLYPSILLHAIFNGVMIAARLSGGG
jgi:membrane protease YdiL (CAAX protease family)